jgi:tetratricopeptide (TPR) repeat protein
MNEEEDSNNIIINEINNINVAIEKNDMILAERLCKHVIVLNENSNNIKVKIQLLTIFKILIKLLILNNELNEASKYAEQCLCNTALLLGGYHIDTANAMTLVASILKKGNREQQEEAEYIYSQAIEIYKANSDNSLLASTIMNMAMTIEAQGELRLHDAIQYYYDALQMKRKIYGEKHSETGDSLLCLASCLARSGNNLEAAARYEQAYSVYKELRKNNEQAQTRLELCKKSLSTLLKKKSDELLKENKITEASVVHTASELGVI